MSRGARVRWDNLVGDEGGLIAVSVAAGVIRLSERVVAPGQRAYFHLVEGHDTDLLIDGGWGFCRTLDALRRDRERPLAAVATHSHVDHIGALHLAAPRFAHTAEAEVFADPSPMATQALPYLDGLRFLADGGAIDTASIRQEPCPIHRAVADGDRIDIGGRTFEIMHTPGHSPGSIALLDRAAGLLFCADTVHDGDILDALPGSDPAALLASHERLARVEFSLALPGHGGILDREAFLQRIRQHRAEAERRQRGPV